MTQQGRSKALAEAAPDLARVLKRSLIHTQPQFAVSEVRIETVRVPMSDGTRLATDLYLPPVLPAPAVAMRTPYGRGMDAVAGVLLSFARRGYVAISQDCRGTGDSEPETWDYYMFEPEDSYDLVEWVSRQPWFGGFLGSCGGSYIGQTQWQMAMHPSMSTIVPDMSGLGMAVNTGRLHMFLNAYARSVGKGQAKVVVPYFELEAQMLMETLATGYFNEPLCRPLPDELMTRFPQLRHISLAQGKHWLWERYCNMTCAERASFVKLALNGTHVTAVDVESLAAIFGHQISHDRHTLPSPRMDKLCKKFHAPVLMRTGWYDWGLNDALATWALLRRHAPEPMRSSCRLFIGPSAHNTLGYHEGIADHAELHHAYGINTGTGLEMLLRWYEAVRDGQFETWPQVIYYLMGANEWRAGSEWPLPDAQRVPLYLHARGLLSTRAPTAASQPDQYIYDPNRPTPTVGGSIVSFVYPPGSVDVSRVQSREDVLSYTTEPLTEDLEVVGPIKVILYASSTAVDTDFSARISDVFQDGRAIQLQSGLLRARYRNLEGEPQLLQPSRIYRFEIDMWATANCFKLGHCLRIDISSADFPRFDRNSNRGGGPGEPIPAHQNIYHDPEHPSHVLLSVLRNGAFDL